MVLNENSGMKAQGRLLEVRKTHRVLVPKRVTYVASIRSYEAVVVDSVADVVDIDMALDYDFRRHNLDVGAVDSMKKGQGGHTAVADSPWSKFMAKEWNEA